VCVSDTGILGSSVFRAAISSDNRFVALTSPSPLVADDTNGSSTATSATCCRDRRSESA
jgi:hypothetical protein